MKRSLMLLLLALWAIPQVWAVSANLTTNGSSCPAATNTTAIVVGLAEDKGGATLTVAGTWTGTISFYGTGSGSINNGGIWTALSVTPLGSATTVTSTTSNGTWQVNVAGFTGICMLSSASMTGTATVTVTPSAASAKSNGSAGSGGTPGGSNTQVQYNNSSAFGGIADVTSDGTNMTVANGGTLTIASGGTLTCASGSTCPAGGAVVYNTPFSFTMVGTDNTSITGASPITLLSSAGADSNYEFSFHWTQTTLGVTSCGSSNVFVMLCYTDADSGVSIGGDCTDNSESGAANDGRLTGYTELSGNTAEYSSGPVALYSAGNPGLGSSATWIVSRFGIRVKSGSSVLLQVFQNNHSACTTKPVFEARPLLFGTF